MTHARTPEPPSDRSVVCSETPATPTENLDRGVPIAQTLDAESNRRSQRRMLELAADPRWVIPGHDPLVFGRFPHVKDNVVSIPR